MKCPSSRNSRPNGTVSCTSTAWKADLNFSSSFAERTTNPHSGVISSYRTSAGKSCVAAGAPSALFRLPSVILSAAKDRLVLRALRLHRRLERAKQALRLVAVVGGQVADVDV